MIGAKRSLTLSFSREKEGIELTPARGSGSSGGSGGEGGSELASASWIMTGVPSTGSGDLAEIEVSS